jgi:hypothetical protein
MSTDTFQKYVKRTATLGYFINMRHRPNFSVLLVSDTIILTCFCYPLLFISIKDNKNILIMSIGTPSHRENKHAIVVHWNPSNKSYYGSPFGFL